MTQAQCVLHVITGLDMGGAERMLWRITAQAGAKRSDWPRQVVVSLMDDGAYGTDLRRAGVTVHSLGMQRGRWSKIGALFHLMHILKQERPSVVMTWLYHADLLGTVAAALSGRPPVIWNLRCSDMDLTSYSRLTRIILRILAQLSRFPYAVAANSDSGRAAHEACGYRPRRWLSLPNGFDLDVWYPDDADRTTVRAELGVSANDILIGLVARVDAQKDHATFLSAASLVAQQEPRARFLLVGQGTDHLPLPPQLNGRLYALGQRDDIPRLTRAMDIGTLSSISEGFPNVVGEAMASGLPCVVTQVGEAPRVVGDTGRVVPPRAPEAMAEAILSLLRMPSEEREALGTAARQRIAKNWSLSTAANAYADAWSQAAEAR